VVQFTTHHAEGLVHPNFVVQKTVTGFKYPRACRFRKHQIGQFLPILATFYEFLNHVLKKVGRASSGNLFSI
jgi:hypothetical protein